MVEALLDLLGVVLRLSARLAAAPLRWLGGARALGPAAMPVVSNLLGAALLLLLLAGLARCALG